MKKITLNTFRRIDDAHDMMARACMPQADARSPRPWRAPLCGPRVPATLVAQAPGSRLVRPLTYTLAEVR